MKRIRQWTVLEPTADGRPGIDVIERDGTTKFGRDGGLVNIADPRLLLLEQPKRRTLVEHLIAEDRIVMDQAVLVPATPVEVPA